MMINLYAVVVPGATEQPPQQSVRPPRQAEHNPSTVLFTAISSPEKEEVVKVMVITETLMNK